MEAWHLLCAGILLVFLGKRIVYLMFLLEICGITYVKLVFAKECREVTAYGYFVLSIDEEFSACNGKHSFAVSGRFV